MEYPGKPKTCPHFKQFSGNSGFFFSCGGHFGFVQVEGESSEIPPLPGDAGPGSLRWFCLVCAIPGTTYILNLKPGKSLSKGLWPNNLSAAQSSKVFAKLQVLRLPLRLL